MSTNLQNSIWPNAGGTLGQIKVQIPDGVTTTWPTGDALVHNFVFNKGKLVGFVDTKALIANSSKTTIFPYEYVNIYLPSISEGEMTYNHDQCAYFILNGKVIKGDIPSDEDDIPSDEELEIITKKYLGCKTVYDVVAVDPNYLTTDIIDGVWKEGLGDLENGNSNNYADGGMFYYCTALTSFSSDLSSLTDGSYMFYYCKNLSEFSSDLSMLTNGSNMFFDCNKLTSFTSDLSSLTNGDMMFCNCSALTLFSSNLSSLPNGYQMFQRCYNLTTFNADLSSLTNGSNMFYGCGILASFTSDLSNLTDGNYMFYGCNLDTPSVQNIADTINTYNGKIDIGINKSFPDEQDKEAFNKMVSKGWTVYVNGSDFNSPCFSRPTCCASLTTLDETGQEITTPIPFWAKPVPSDEQHAQYVDSEGNFYNILGAQFIYGDNLETYGMFTSLEDAAANMRLKKIGEEEIETA